MKENHLNLVELMNNVFLIHLMKLDENNKMLIVVDQHVIMDEQLLIFQEIYKLILYIVHRRMFWNQNKLFQQEK